MAVVDVDPDGLLVHVLNEDAVDADDLGRLEAQVIGGGEA
jgi:predicted regulator of Ras-like GTPase activity (Roadblock/LC7/MglB family)